jgi:DNA repair ATPase RecN
MYCFQQKIKNFKQQVHKWNKEVFGNIFQERKMLEQKLENLQGQFIHVGYTITQHEEESELKRHVEEIHKHEEILWRHKSQVQWLNEGEKKTKNFHHSMIHGRLINRITKLDDSQGNTLLTHQEIMHELTDFYKDLLSKPMVDRTSAIEWVTQNIPTIITQEQNEALMTPIM